LLFTSAGAKKEKIFPFFRIRRSPFQRKAPDEGFVGGKIYGSISAVTLK
jgi:hypothetical protein